MNKAMLLGSKVRGVYMPERLFIGRKLVFFLAFLS